MILAGHIAPIEFSVVSLRLLPCIRTGIFGLSTKRVSEVYDSAGKKPKNFYNANCTGLNQSAGIHTSLQDLENVR